MDSPQLENNKKKRKENHYLEFEGVIYIDTSPIQTNISAIVHRFDEETATLIDAQEQLDFEEEDGVEDDDDMWDDTEPEEVNTSSSQVSASPVTVPQTRKVRLQEAYFPPNYCDDNSTDSMPEDYDDNEDDDSSIEIEYLVDQTCSSAKVKSEF
jgi:hypothetical protein